MFTFMTAPRLILGITRSLIGLFAWVAPDITVRFFGMDPERSDRFVGRLFGARELALGMATLTAPPAALPAVAAMNIAIDSADAIAGFDERRRGNLSTQATVLGPAGALGFVALGLIVAKQASSAAVE